MQKGLGFSLVFFIFLFLASALACGQSSAPDNSSNTTFEQLSAQAAASREAGRVDDAIRLYQRALKLQPDWAEGWWYIGTLNYDADHYAEAIPALQSLVALSPQMGPALAFLGLSEFETKDYKNSLLHLDRAHQQGYGDDAELEKVAVYHLALLYNWSGGFEKIAELLGPAAQRSHPPDDIKAALGMALLRIPLLPSEVDPGKDSLIRAAGEAAVLLRGGNSAAAETAVQQLSAEFPRTPYLHYAHAVALVAAGKSEEALQEFEEETKASPQSALAYVQIASLQLQRKHPKQALAPARKAVLLAPQASSSHEVLARTLKALGEAPAAAKESALAKKLEGRAMEVDMAQRQQYGRSRLGEETVSQSATAATSLNTTSEDSFETLIQKGAAAQAAGQIDATVSYYQRALALRPEWEQGWMNLGTIYYASAHYPEAVAALKNAASINGRNGNVWALLGLSEFETKDYKNSLIHLERGQDLGLASNKSAMQIARYHLAILLIRDGEFERATDLLTPESGSGPLAEPVKFALGMSLLRIRSFPEEVDPASNALVRLAGETAALLSESKYDLAFAKLEQLLQMNSRVPYLHYAYGTALASLSRYDEAEKQFAEESVITPSSALPYLRRSTIALQLRRAEEASQLAARAVQLAPESGEGHYLSGRSLLELGKTTEALQELETARTLAPNSPEVRFSLARAYTKAGKPEAAEQERAAFDRLNAMVQTQRSQTGSQAYGAIQSQNGIRAAQPSSQPQNSAHPE